MVILFWAFSGVVATHNERLPARKARRLGSYPRGRFNAPWKLPSRTLTIKSPDHHRRRASPAAWCKRSLRIWRLEIGIDLKAVLTRKIQKRLASRLEPPSSPCYRFSGYYVSCCLHRRWRAMSIASAGHLKGTADCYVLWADVAWVVGAAPWLRLACEQ
jgi:hypothetical protein